MAPRFLGRKCKNGRQQPAQHVENLMHHHLSRTPTQRTWRVAIHPVLGDIDIEAAQIDGAKLIERVIDLMELERFVGCSTIANHFIQAFQDPAIDEGQSNGPLTSILSPRKGEATAGTLGLAFRLSPRWGEDRVRGRAAARLGR